MGGSGWVNTRAGGKKWPWEWELLSCCGRYTILLCLEALAALVPPALPRCDAQCVAEPGYSRTPLSGGGGGGPWWDARAFQVGFVVSNSHPASQRYAPLPDPINAASLMFSAIVACDMDALTLRVGVLRLPTYACKSDRGPLLCCCSRFTILSPEQPR